MAEQPHDKGSQVVKHMYKKNKGFSGFRGEAFEFKTCALLFARGSKLKYKFKMASSLDGYGVFDDIIFNFDTGVEKFCLFMQLKNKSKDKIRFKNLLSKKHDFGLDQYYDSYMEIQRKFQTQRNDVPFDVEFCNCVFVLYTNADVEKSLKCNSVSEEIPLNLVNAGGCVMKLTEDQHKKVYDENFMTGLPEFYNFLSKFFIMYNQPDEDKFDSFICSELVKCVNLTDAHKKTALDTFCKEVTNWWKRLQKSTYLTHEWTQYNPLRVTVNHIAALKILSLLEERKLEIENMSLKFCDKALKELENVIHKRKVTLILTAHVKTTVTKVHQIFHKTGKYGIVKFQDLQDRNAEILLAWKNEMFDALIICDVSSLVKLDSLCSEISNICEYSENKKAILIIETQSNKERKTIKKSFGKNLTEYTDDTDFSQFELVEQHKLLEKQCVFQGYELSLSRFGENILEWLDGETLTFLFEGKPKIGNPLPHPVQYYIPRTLESHRIVDHKIMEEAGVVFCLYGGLQSGYSNLMPHSLNIINFEERVHNPSYRYFWVNDVHEFETLCIEQSDVIWLHKVDQLLILKRSYGAVHIIEKYLDKATVTKYHPQTLLDGDDKIVVVTAEPGMGKSALLTHLSKQTKYQHPHLWIVRININDYTDILCKFKGSIIQEDNAIKLLKKAANVDNVFEKQLFECSYKTGNMVVLVDGIDEISPHYSEVVFQILEVLFSSAVKRVWVTSRPFLKSKLDEISGVKCYRIIPFNRNDQKRFLRLFWENKIEGMDETVLNSCTDYILKLADRCLNYNNNDFMGIPLQCVLLAEVFEDIIKCTNPEKILASCYDFNILQLYDRFIDKKWTVYNEEKKKANLLNVHEIEDDMHLKNFFIQNNKLAALLSLFTSEELRLLNYTKIRTKAIKYLNKLKEVDDKTGLIIAVIGETAQFLHRTIAEYFAAKWLFDHLDKVGQFLKECVFKPEYIFTRRMLDYQLAEGLPLHVSILNGNLKENIDKLEVEVSVNKQDLGGRTALHFAVMYQLPIETKILLQHGGDENIKDSLLLQSSVDYASYMFHSDIKFEPLSKIRNLSSCEVITEMMKERPETRSILSFEMFPYNKKDVNDTKTLLHRFVQYYVNKGGKASAKVMSNIAHENRTGIIHPNVIASKMSQSVLDIDKHVNTDIHRNSRFGFLEYVMHLEGGKKFNSANVPAIPMTLYFPVKNNEDEAYELERNGLTVKVVSSKNGRALCKVLDFFIYEYGKILIDTTGFSGNFKSALGVAVEQKNLKLTKLLLENGAPVNSTTKEDPICVVAKMGHLELFKILLKYKPVDELCYPLTVAVQFGKLQIVKLLLAKCTKKNVRQITLSAAERKQHLQVTEFLMENVVREYHELFNLCVAAECGFLEMVKFLLELGDNINMVHECYGTPLIAAADGGQVEVVKFLLNKGARVDIKDKVGKTALHATACSFPTEECTSSKTMCRYVQICLLLIQNGADVNAVNTLDYGCIPLHCAIVYKHVHVASCLLKAGAQLVRRGYIHSPLYISIDYGSRFEITNLLLSHCNSIDSPFEYRYSPLCASIFSRSPDYKLINLLLDKGASVNFICKEKCSPLLSATIRQNILVVPSLLWKGADINMAHNHVGWTPLHVAACLPSTDIALLLLAQGASVNVRDKHDRIPLHFAVSNRLFMGIPYLLMKNPNSLKAADRNGWTPLFFAAKFGLTFRLCGTDCGIHEVDKEGRTALFVSALNGHAVDVLLLLYNKTNVNFFDKHGLCVLHVAACGGHLEVVRTLLSAGACADATDKFGFKPLHYAEWNNHKDVVELLKGNTSGVKDVNNKLKEVIRELNEWNNRFECEMWNETMSSYNHALNLHFVDNLDRILRHQEHGEKEKEQTVWPFPF